VFKKGNKKIPAFYIVQRAFSILQTFLTWPVNRREKKKNPEPKIVGEELGRAQQRIGFCGD